MLTFIYRIPSALKKFLNFGTKVPSTNLIIKDLYYGIPYIVLLKPQQKIHLHLL